MTWSLPLQLSNILHPDVFTVSQVGWLPGTIALPKGNPWFCPALLIGYLELTFISKGRSPIRNLGSQWMGVFVSTPPARGYGCLKTTLILEISKMAFWHFQSLLRRVKSIMSIKEELTSLCVKLAPASLNIPGNSKVFSASAIQSRTNDFCEFVARSSKQLSTVFCGDRKSTFL